MMKGAHITRISSFNDVNFNTFISENCLVIFDVDETLIQPQDTYLINEFTPQGEKLRQDLITTHPEISTAAWTDLDSIILLEAQRPLIEPSIIQKINLLQERNIPVVACTAMNTGLFGRAGKMELWRYNQLKSLGFEGSFAHSIFEFDLQNRHPVFYKGILATDTAEKGPALGIFLDTMALKPKTIIMFDNLPSYLSSVKDECKKRGITFHGYEYQGAKQKAWDDQLIQFQAQYLITHKHWISDTAAQQLMAVSQGKSTQVSSAPTI